jgi:hypothetical protein
VNFYAYAGNNPINGSDPYGFRGPDYLSLNVNVAIPNPLTGTLVGVSGQFSLDRYWNLYAGLGGTVGKSSTGVSGSLTAGWLNTFSTPSYGTMTSFLSGSSFNAGGGVVGYNLAWTPGVGTATEFGLFSPQAGASYHYSVQIAGRTNNALNMYSYDYLLNDPASNIIPAAANANNSEGLLSIGSTGTYNSSAPSVPLTYTGSSQTSTYTAPASSAEDSAAGGYLIYPNKPNTNMTQSVYSK